MAEISIHERVALVAWRCEVGAHCARQEGSGACGWELKRGGKGRQDGSGTDGPVRGYGEA